MHLTNVRNALFIVLIGVEKNYSFLKMKGLSIELLLKGNSFEHSEMKADAYVFIPWNIIIYN